MELLVDSGAAAPVLFERLLEDHSIAQGDAAWKGVHDLTADGGRVPNLGEMKVRLLTKEQHRTSVTFQVADIQKPILSVGALAASGHEVSFTKWGGTITIAKSRKKIAFKKRGGVYVLEVLVAPGDKRSATADGRGPARRSATADAPRGSQAPGFTRQGTQ